jgi:uncharacterized protein YecE (DUF72 family)
MSILIGTASWTDKKLIESGRFYPKEAKTAEARLRYYASIFPLVEVDSSYYGIPTPTNAQLWVERTPEAFTFNVKAFRLFTGHQTDPKVLHKDIQQALGTVKTLYYRQTPPEISVELWRRFRESIAPIKNAGKLGLVHFQFPPWLVCNREGQAHVAHCVEQMAGHTVGIEFRHRSWLDEAHRVGTIEFLRKLGAVHTIVDGPQGFANSVPLLAGTTNTEYTLVRLHGRNVDTYNIKGAASAAERFDYDYPDQELREIMAEVIRLAYKAKHTHIIFNNCDKDKGQRNGLTFLKMLLAHG